KRTRQDQVAEEFPSVGAHAINRRAFVTTVERAQKIISILTIDGQQSWTFSDQFKCDLRTAKRWKVSRGEPWVGLDDIRVDHRLFEIEDRTSRFSGENLTQSSVAPIT